MNILVSGFLGKMGQAVYNASKEFDDINIVEGFDKKEVIENSRCSFENIDLIYDINMSQKCDVVVDFSHISNLDTILNFCAKNKKPLVLATTGLKEEDEKKVLEFSKIIPIFKSSNMSEGVFVLLDLIKKATKMLEGWDIEIVEKHHNNKKDAPSGTAKMMFNEVKSVRPNLNMLCGRNENSGKREPTEVGVHAVRGGGAVGEHEIIFFSENETVTLTHEAYSKSIFAEGALKATKFIYNKENGLYSMKNLFE